MAPYARTIMVLGATGVVGGRLVSGILKTTACDVVMAGRDPAELAAVPRRAGPRRAAPRRAAPRRAGRVMTVVLDTPRVKPNELRATGACTVIDAAGPFQGSSYRLAQAAIAAGLHYIDLADARDFVAGFGALD